MDEAREGGAGREKGGEGEEDTGWQKEGEGDGQRLGEVVEEDKGEGEVYIQEGDEEAREGGEEWHTRRRGRGADTGTARRGEG